MALSALKDAVKEILLELKTANFLEISTQDLEKTLNKNGIFYARSTIGKLMTSLGIPVLRKGRDGRLYDLKNWTGVCIHYWMVEPPNGPYSGGTCQKCGEEKFFSNALESFGWSEQRPYSWANKKSFFNENDFRELEK